MKRHIMIITAVLAALWSSGINGQHRITRDVLANSATSTEGGVHRIRGTTGQMAIGLMVATSGRINGGFWQAGSANDTSSILPDMPLPLGAATIEVWNDNIYLFGGGDHWWGVEISDKVYRLDRGQWVVYDSIPDNSNWGMESAMIGDEVYLLGGWRSGGGLFRKFDISSGDWKSLTNSPNTGHWGNTVQLVNEKLYLFNVGGKVFQYSFFDSSWTAKTDNDTITYEGLRSVVYQDEIYILGYRNDRLNKYDPQLDRWTVLAPPPYPVASCAMELLNGKIYCIGGSVDGGPGTSGMYRSVISYDLASGSWSTENLELSSRRIWMASAVYNDQIYVFGGFDSLGVAVDIVEAIKPPTIVNISDPHDNQIPDNFHLRQNYPNPFNPQTTIEFELPVASVVTLEIFDVLGRQVEMPYRASLPVGHHKFVWKGTDNGGNTVASGMYFYRLTAGDFVKTKKMLLIH